MRRLPFLCLMQGGTSLSMPVSASLTLSVCVGLNFVSACVYFHAQDCSDRNCISGLCLYLRLCLCICCCCCCCHRRCLWPVYLMNNARVPMCIDTRMYTCMFICTHAHRQVNGEESTTNSFSRAEPVEPCPWDQTNVVHAKRALRPPSVENSDNESSEGESDQR